MAIPPTIPTSFVPKQPVQAAKRRASGTNPFLALAFFILGAAIIGSGLVFGYGFYLESVAKAKAAELVAAQNAIDQATVSQFIRLRDRFVAAHDILNEHIALSQFFTVLETLTLQGVRFTTLKVSVPGDRVAEVQMNGTAKSFNALAAQSASFASDKRIKRAIFSGITTGKETGGVTFSLEAELDPALVVLSTLPPVAAPPVGTTTTP